MEKYHHYQVSNEWLAAIIGSYGLRTHTHTHKFNYRQRKEMCMLIRWRESGPFEGVAACILYADLEDVKRLRSLIR